MEAFLVIALILTNLSWLYFYDRQEKRSKDERRELFNRLAEPEMVIPPDEIVSARIKAAEIMAEEWEPPKDETELAAVGHVDPPLIEHDDE